MVRWVLSIWLCDGTRLAGLHPLQRFVRSTIWALLLTGATSVASAQDRLLEPGDTVRLTCEQDPRLDVERTVGSTGTVSIPQVGDVPAVLMDIRRFASLLSQIASEKLGAELQVDAIEVANSESPVRVEGLTKTPFSRRWQPNLTVSALLADAQLRELADHRLVTLSTVEGKLIAIDTKEADPELLPGDRVIVGQASSDPMVIVVGPLQHPGAVPAVPGLTLAKAIAALGGITGHGDPNHITIHRATGKTEVVDLAGSAGLPLYRDDEVSIGVTDQRLFVSVEGDVVHPGLVEFREGMTLTQAVYEAGGAKHPKSTLVVLRRIMDKQMKTTRYDFSKIQAHLVADPVLMASDLVLLGGG